MASRTVGGCSPVQGDLPERIFAPDCYPSHAVRINSYSRPRYLIDILEVLDGTSELQKILSSPLGPLFSLPVRQCSLSGQLVHQLLCRQLHTDQSDVLWFVFAGHPFRFSFLEFEEVTGLHCSSFPHSDDISAATMHAKGKSPYWYKLIGGKIGGATVEDILLKLKAERDMPSWQKIRLALIVIVEGVLLCRTQPVKPSIEVVEMSKNVEFFLSYPWGRHAFKRMLRMVKVGDYLPNRSAVIRKLKQSSLAIHGFPLCLQLFAFRVVPMLLQFLPHSADKSTFLDREVMYLPKLKSYHAENILALEHDPVIRDSSPHMITPVVVSRHNSDPRVTLLEQLISSGFKFSHVHWFGGDSSLPSLRQSMKRKRGSIGDAESRSDKRRSSKNLKSSSNVDTIFERRLKGFKESILREVEDLLNGKSNQLTTCNGSTQVRRHGSRSTHLRRSSRSILRKSTGSQAASNHNQRSSMLNVTTFSIENETSNIESHNTFAGSSTVVDRSSHLASMEPICPSSHLQSTTAEIEKNNVSTRVDVEKTPKPSRVTRSGIAGLHGKLGLDAGVSALRLPRMKMPKITSQTEPPNHDKQKIGTSSSRVRVVGDGVEHSASKDVGITTTVRRQPRTKRNGDPPVSLLEEASSFFDSSKQIDGDGHRSSPHAHVESYDNNVCTSTPSSPCLDIPTNILYNAYPDVEKGFILVGGPSDKLVSTIVSSQIPTNILYNAYPDVGKGFILVDEPSENLSNFRGVQRDEGAEENYLPSIVTPPALSPKAEENNNSPAGNLSDPLSSILVLPNFPQSSLPKLLTWQPAASKQYERELALPVSPAPAHNLRSKKKFTAIDVKDGSASILSSLEINCKAKVSSLNKCLAKNRKRQYTILGQSVPDTLFTDILKSQQWLSSLHIDLLVAFLWNKHGSYLQKQRITILDLMFTSIIGNKFMSFTEEVNTNSFVWHPLLIAYVKGMVTGRSSKLLWLRDVDMVYLPMNWGTKHWVALAIDLCKGHIYILDPFEDWTSARKVNTFMAPLSQMLPRLISLVCGYIPTSSPQSAFTFSRVSGVAQNRRGGDCGPLTVKFIECHAHKLHDAMTELTTQQVDNLRIRYALDLYEEYVSKL